MNSVRIHILFALQIYEFIQIPIDIKYEFIYFFAVQNKSCERARAASACCERAARATRAKPKLTSCPNQAVPGYPDC